MPAKGTKHAPLSTDAIELVAARFRTLGEPIRIQLLQALQRGERNVSDLVAAVGSTQSNVSKHLRILQDAGLVGRRQDGNSVYYSIADPTVFALCDAVCTSIGTRLTQHATLAAELRRRTGRR
ncbi:MAG TPA: metalloregulator ArsR/SmtB family transcription factor [Thermoanaerobaculia bacterium]|nr:metalloregulator ArsR/SmtB family transcription factor [Thermoanaerobaculia bacterium]